MKQNTSKADPAPASGQHTPGPWKTGNRWKGGPGLVCEYCDKASTDERPGHIQILAHHGQYGVATCAYPYGDDQDAQQAERNATLIAAAPALLETLQELVDSLTLGVSTKFHVTPNVVSVLEKARAALAQAKGGQS